jgi:hypothetical protein
MPILTADQAQVDTMIPVLASLQVIAISCWNLILRYKQIGENQAFKPDLSSFS